MRARRWTWLGIADVAALAIGAASINVARNHFARDDDESLHERTLAYARAHLGGAAVASIAKGGDPDSASSVRTTPGESRGDGALLSASDELAARKAWPAASVRREQIERAQQSFSRIKFRGHRRSTKPFIWHSIGPSVAFQPGVLGFTTRDQVTAGRTTALVVDRTCTRRRCRIWIGAAGGGIWRTERGLHTSPRWKFSSAGLGSNAFGSLVQDPNDSTGDTLYAGTGEPNASADSESGVGLYKSTDGGDSWHLIAASAAIAETRSIAKIAIDTVDVGTIYIATARGVRGISSTSGGAVSVTGTVQPNVGVYKTTDGGATWTLAWDAQTDGSIRGATDVEIDPFDHTTVYASAFQLGIHRSQGGGPFQQVFAGQAPNVNIDRTEFALAALPDGKTRIYATNGSQGGALPYSALFRTDDASLLEQESENTDLWKKLTSNVNGDPFYATFDFCTGQCWYDQDVVTPQGHPDTVFVIGSYTYGELGLRSNARAVLRSTTAGEPDPANNDRTFTDVTWDAQSPPYGIHPDQHELAFHPTNPNIWWSTSDGGVVRSSGEYTDISTECASRPLAAASILTCTRLLSAVPTRIDALNEGLVTLQFMSVSVNPQNPTGEVQGGTQDNGTWLYTGDSKVWKQTIYGDGGTSGFDAGNPAIRFNQFFGGFGDVNFRSGDPESWVVVTAPMLNSREAVGFYWPEIADPSVPGTMYTGFQSVWRTKDNGGDQSFLEANCPEFTTPGQKVGCGDWVPLGGPGGPGTPGDLTSALYGADRAGGVLGRVARAPSDTGTLWASTSVGRLFVTTNADVEPATDAVFTRLDTLAANDPNRFISGIYVDPSNPNRAWVSYSGYNTTVGSTAPGHVFEVTFDPAGPSATWNDWSYDLDDLPVTDVARDDPTGDLYVSTDFGVLRLEAGDQSWEVAGTGLPIVETPGLAIVPSARRLYAATHGLGMWYLTLPYGNNASTDQDRDRDR